MEEVNYENEQTSTNLVVSLFFDFHFINVLCVLRNVFIRNLDLILDLIWKYKKLKERNQQKTKRKKSAKKLKARNQLHSVAGLLGVFVH